MYHVNYKFNSEKNTMNKMYSFLDANNITYEQFDHPAVFTCEESAKYCPPMPGASIKNLFLYNKKTDQHFLAVVSDEKKVDLKELKKTLGVDNLSFASEERLQKYLGVAPGSVTVLGLINDTEHAVRVIFDAALRNQALQCHPLVNTATLVIPFDGIEKFLSLTGHSYQFLEIPER